MAVYALLRSLILICAREMGFASRLLSALPSSSKVPVATWRDEYADGDWSRLHQIGELGHYSVIAGYFGRFKPGGSVLDVACGEGILQRHLKPHRYSRYLGIDYVPEAISAASGSKDETTDFAVADAADYTTEQKFDAIIFNECLYYFDDPMRVVQRYVDFLEVGGMLIISNYSSLSNLNMIRSIRQTLNIDDEVSIINRDGISWTVQLARPKRRASAHRQAA
jgi:2-polyprenyl-3-methyl-5-hydroxy-6-metoxy-1,4-benzoquinol methylase